LIQLIPLSLAIFSLLKDAKIRCHQLQLLATGLPVVAVETISSVYFCRLRGSLYPPVYNFQQFQQYPFLQDNSAKGYRPG
jgi:hypothetical protein